MPAAVAGVLGGALTTSISINGPPLVLWLEGEGIRPAEFRATLAAAFLALDAVGAALLVSTEGSATVDLEVPGPLVACVLGGYGLGALTFRRLESERLFPVVLALVVCTGIASVLAGVL